MWDRAFLRSVIFVSLPIVLQELLGASLHIIDGIMVSGLGDAAYSGVMQANRFTFLFQLFTFGVSSGGAIFLSQFWGARDIPRMRQSMGIALRVSLGISALFLCGGLFLTRPIISLFLLPGESFELAADYLRTVSPGYLLMAVNIIYASALKSSEKTYIPMLAGSAGILVNTLFNYGLIYGKLGLPALGVRGAALATVLSAAVTLSINLAFSYGKKLPAGANFREMFVRDAPFLKKFLKTVWPVVMNEGLWALGITMYGIFNGMMGDVNIAAMGINNTINDLVWVFIMGVTTAAAILVGKTLGEGHRARAYLYAKRLLAAGMAGGLVLGLVLMTARMPLVGLFTGLSEAARDKAQRLILIASIGLSIRALNCINIVGVLRSGGDTLYSLLLDVGSMWLVGVPLVGLAVTVFHWPIEIVYGLTLVDEVLKIAIGMPHFKTRKWIHVLTTNEEETGFGNA